MTTLPTSREECIKAIDDAGKRTEFIKNWGRSPEEYFEEYADREPAPGCQETNDGHNIWVEVLSDLQILSSSIQVTYLKTNEDGSHDVYVDCDEWKLWQVEIEDGEPINIGKIDGDEIVVCIPDDESVLEALQEFASEFQPPEKEDEDKPIIGHFGLYHAGHGESVALVEMDVRLLKQDGYIVDHATMTLRPITNGGMWTLMPADDPTVLTLKKVKHIYEQITKSPTPLFGAMIGKVDELIQTVALMFGEVEYVVVETPMDLEVLISGGKNIPDNYEQKTVKRSILGNMLTKALVGDAEETNGMSPEDEMVLHAAEDAAQDECCSHGDCDADESDD